MKTFYRFDQVDGIIIIQTRSDKGAGISITGKETFGAGDISISSSLSDGNYDPEATVTAATTLFTWTIEEGIADQTYIRIEVDNADAATDLQIGISGGFEQVFLSGGVVEVV